MIIARAYILISMYEGLYHLPGGYKPAFPFRLFSKNNILTTASGVICTSGNLALETSRAISPMKVKCNFL